MRIAYVTAHLPPDFTSGATLLVDRLAREAARRGHEVEVFSGAIRRGLDDGEVHVDPATDERHFTIRWIGTAARTDQDVDGNWDNPLAAAAAERWLREFRPDVVHMHTLQTLGVGVVDAAIDSGAHTVVTMHDLWWWCARLFLVDTQLRPCPLVTDVGTCACARSASWRRDRAERLGRTLDGVDRILAPSTALRDVIVANGIDPDRVVVDENHVTDAVAASLIGPVRSSPTNATGEAVDASGTRVPVRFLYIGGSSPLKGAEVVRAAVQQLTADPAVDVGDWQLSAYGLEPDPTAPTPTGVRLLAPFDAAQVVDVMAAHDVLVLPSLARESFSIAAREALATGLAVVTSDCLGPEEVVIDGVNGMVVPTGNAAALAGALRSLVVDRRALARLRAGAAAAPPPLRTAADHVDALLEIYTAEPPTAGNPRTVGFVIGVDGEPARWRAHHARAALALGGDDIGPIAHHLEPGLEQIMADCDILLVQQAPATEAMSSSIRALRARGVLVVFDASDERDGPESLTIAQCDGVIAATSTIADRIAASTGIRPVVVADAAGLVELQLAELARTATPAGRDGHRVRVGYVSGALSDQTDVDLLTPTLADLLAHHRHVDVVVVGPFQLGEDLTRFGTRVQLLDPPAWRGVPALMRGIDINLSPMSPDRSGTDGSLRSWLNASMVEAATIASTSGASADVIEHGRTGLLCASLTERGAAVRHLVADDALRVRLGAAARRDLELHHSPHVTARRYRDAFDLLGSFPRDGRRPTPPSWAVAQQTGPVVPLASYDLGDTVVGDAQVLSVGTGGRTRARRLVGRLRRR
jgi:glycosyltransferase involved in cell wall biosynthesis